jgi:hypothetical protein
MTSATRMMEKTGTLASSIGLGFPASYEGVRR